MSGKVKIENDFITWIWKRETLANFKVGDILVIGELTYNSLNDDYYLVFVLKDGTWKLISMYIENLDELLEFLILKFDPCIKETQIANSIHLKSKISYPIELRGNEIFTIEENDIHLSDIVKSYLEV